MPWRTVSTASRHRFTR